MEMSTSTSTMLSNPVSDPVSSLRAAALSTLKAKRRKPVQEKLAVPTLPRPPPPADLFQLDYGQEDNTPDALLTDIKPLDILPVNKSPPSVNNLVSTAADPNREEGEISEEEDPPSPARAVLPASRLSRSPVPAQQYVRIIKPKSPLPAAAPLPNSPSPEVQSPLMQSHPVLTEKLSDPSPTVPVACLDEQPSDIIVDQISANMEVPPPIFRIGPENVRPGLSATQAEYDTIKEIILDLLGWGVPVEYLVGFDLSREVIYYVFHELNLQLPDTFDATGIVPYTPETFSQMPHPSIMPLTALSGMLLSVEPASPTVAPSIRPSTPPAPIKLAPTFDSSFNEDLHDMERRRRQELMARKAAVQASRKSKLFTDVSQREPSNMETEDVVMSSIAPETVDDFLKTLAPVTKRQPSPTFLTSPQTAILDTNDVDHNTVITFPNDHESQTQLPDPVLPTSATSTDSEPQLAFPPPSSAEAPPTSVGSSITTFSHTSGSDTDLVTPSDLQPIPQQINIPAPRRGSKRPVASDFVDFDPTPRRNEINSRQEHSNGLVRTVGPVRSLTGTSFHNIGGSRRCVIDLSDSEDDGEIYQPQPVVEDHAWLRRDKRNNATDYPSPAPSTKPPSTPGTMSPAALMLEIRKMREQIAQREETRLRKLALASSAATSEVTTPSNAGTRLIVTKQEGVNAGVPSPTPIPAGKNGTVATHPTPVLEPSLISSEDSMMTTLPGLSKPNEIGPSNPSVAGGNRAKDPPAWQEKATQVIDQQMVQVPQAAKERTVDADSSSSPSTQTTPITPALQEQGERRQDRSEPSNFKDTSEFSVYRSPFELFPRLRDHPRTVLSPDPVSSLSSPSASYMYPSTRSSLSSNSFSVYAERSTPHSLPPFSPTILLPDLKPLKLAFQVKFLDPFKPLCKYEVPGGGTCRDDACDDIHLSKLEDANQMGLVEPTDQDTAEYLFKVMPSKWLAERNIDSPSRISSTLRHLHQQTADNSLPYEDRVAQALIALGPPPAT